MIRVAVLSATLVLAAACSMTPTVTKEATTMTPREIADAGLQCRRIVPIDTNIPRTICASEASWAAYDKKTRIATDDLLAKGRELANAGAFNRN